MSGCRHPCRQSGTKRDMQVIGMLHDDTPKCIFLRYKVSSKVSLSLPLPLLLELSRVSAGFVLDGDPSATVLANMKPDVSLKSSR
jgi:hypothetical protein